MSETVRRYQELAGRNSEAVRRMRAEDEGRCRQLDRTLAETEQLVSRAVLADRMAEVSINTHWETAVEALWSERWLEVKPMPEPAERVPVLSMAQADAEVERTYAVLRDALKRTGVWPRLRGGKGEEAE
jgi:hypothetical protein